MEAYKCNGCGKLLRYQIENHSCNGTAVKTIINDAEYCANFGHDEVESVSADGRKLHYAEEIAVSEIKNSYIYWIGYDANISCQRCNNPLGGRWKKNKTSCMPSSFSQPTTLTNRDFENLTGLKVK